MANNDIEVEIKIPLERKMFLSVRRKVRGMAKFIKTTTQSDEYFTPAHRNFVKPKYPFEWFSIRSRGDKTTLNYKHFHPENVKSHTHCDEFQTEVGDLKQLEKIFSALDLKSLVVVEKEREVYKYRDEFEIALDKVGGLGYFVEIEAVKDFGGIDKTRKKISEFAKVLGIDNIKPDERGYPYLLMAKRGLL